MHSEFLKTVNFGSTKSGLTGSVGVRLLNTRGACTSMRSTTSVYETFPNSGIYASLIRFPEKFRGVIMWDTGEDSPKYASEEYNYTENNGVILDNMKLLFDQISFLRGLQAGRWSLDKQTSEMTFYDEGGTNILLKYIMKDERGNPSIDSVFDRIITFSNAPVPLTEITEPDSDPDPVGE